MTDETETSGSGESSESGAAAPTEPTTPAAPENPTTGGQEQPASPDAPATAPAVASNTRQGRTTADLRYMIGVIIADLEDFFNDVRETKAAEGVDSLFLHELNVGRAAVLTFFNWLKKHV